MNALKTVRSWIVPEAPAASRPGRPGKTLRPAPAWGAAVIVAAILIAYSNSFSGGFVFDDALAITGNSTLRHFASALHPPGGGVTVSGRPILNLSFAANYAAGGFKVWGYHAVNLAIHILAGLTLFGVVRRTLLRWSALSPTRLSANCASQRVGDNALHPTLLAFFIALLWSVHPLQTESVTYLSQRAESLMGLFYLLTFYCFIRGVDPEGEEPPFARAELVRRSSLGASEGGAGEKAARRRSLFWFGLTWLACLFGTATKEVMVSAPVMVLLYDRTFVAGSFREAWRRRSLFYSGLASSWVLLGFLVASTHGRGGTSGFEAGVTWWGYFQTQFGAVCRYLRLAVWPSGQVFDYGTPWAHGPADVWPAAVVVLALAAGTVVAFIRRPALGFLGIWFFAILAPTSLIPGNRQTLAEHRMYLALAPVVAAAVCLLFRWLGRGGLIVCAAAAAICCGLTWRRNEVYRDELTLGADTVAKAPQNPYAHFNYGVALAAAARPAEAMRQYEEALRLKPAYPEAQNNLGAALINAGRFSDAVARYEEAVRLSPRAADAHNGLGLALADAGRTGDAIVQYEEALRLSPDYYEAENNLGNALRSVGRSGEAIVHYERVLRQRPELSGVHDNLGLCLAAAGRLTEAMAQYDAALRLKADNPVTHFHLGVALAAAGRKGEALAQYREAVRLDPDFAEAHYNLGAALAAAGQPQAALGEDEAAVRLKPDFAEAQDNLGAVLAGLGRVGEAIPHFEAAVRLNPNSARAQANLKAARQLLGAQPQAAERTP